MLRRCTHPTEARKVEALDLAWVSTKRAHDALDETATDSELMELLKEVGGRREDRTPDLCIANAI